MKILHVATLFTPNGVFGGPPRVALQQAAELRARGHTVVVAGATAGWDRVPEVVHGVECWFGSARTRIPGIGFAGISARGLSRRLASALAGFDVVHLHMARDLVTLPVALRARRLGVPYVLQCHGMIDPSSRWLSVPLDRFATVPALRGAQAVLAFTEREKHDIAAVAGTRIRTTPIVNAVPRFDAEFPPTSPPEVLYLARLDPRKRPDMFVRVANSLLDEGVRARFTLVGPDTGSSGAVDAEIARGGHDAVRREPAVPADDVCHRMARAAIYVLPSVDEPFPLSVLEAMSVARPVVVTDSCGLAPTVSASSSGIVVDHSQEQLTVAIRRLLEDPVMAMTAGHRGQATVRGDFAIAGVVDELERVYRQATDTHPASRAGVHRADR